MKLVAVGTLIIINVALSAHHAQAQGQRTPLPTMSIRVSIPENESKGFATESAMHARARLALRAGGINEDRAAAEFLSASFNVQCAAERQIDLCIASVFVSVRKSIPWAPSERFRSASAPTSAPVELCATYGTVWGGERHTLGARILDQLEFSVKHCVGSLKY